MPKKLCDYLSRITGGNTVIHICDKDKTIRFCNKLEDIRFADIVDSLGYDVIEEQEYFDPVENRNIIFVVIENFVFTKTKYYIPSNKSVKETLQDIIDDIIATCLSFYIIQIPFRIILFFYNNSRFFITDKNC